MRETSPLVIEDDVLRVEVEHLGARIRSIRHKEGQQELLLSTRWRNAPANAESQWMRRFANGWNVLIPHAGEPYEVDGVQHPYHGEAARRVWELRRHDSGVHAEVALASVPLYLDRSVHLASGCLTIEQQVTNLTDRPVRFGWVEHPVFDGELLRGTTVRGVADTKMSLLIESGSAFDSVATSHGSCDFEVQRLGAVRMQWDAVVFPNVHVWQERRGTIDAPWFGDVDAVGIEPASHPSGRPPVGLGPLVLGPRASLRGWLSLSVSAPQHPAQPPNKRRQEIQDDHQERGATCAGSGCDHGVLPRLPRRAHHQPG